MANWEPIRACLDKYPNLERLQIIHSEETKKQANETLMPYLAEQLGQGPLHSFKELVRKPVRDNRLVLEEELGDLNDFNAFSFA